MEKVTLTVGHGTLTPGSTVGLAAHSGDGSNDLTLEGTIAALNGALEGLSYSPEHNHFGSDTLTVEADDLGHTGIQGPKTASGTVPITINAVVYDTAVNDSYSIAENKTLSTPAPGVLSNDTDSDTPALPLSATVVKTTEHGTLTLNSKGSFEYAPELNYHGSDSFTYKDNDTNTDSNEATVTITVEPVVYDAAVNDSYAVHENAELKVAAPGVLSNDTDSDTPALPLTATVVKTAEHGALTLNSDGSFSYAPNANFHGSDSFTYKDNDTNTDSNTATVTITVERVDRAPTVSLQSTTQKTAENSTLSFSSLHANQVTVADSDSEGATEEVTVTAEHGTLTPATTAGLASHSGEGTGVLKLTGTITALNIALEGFSYAPTLNYAGADTVALEINDLGHTGIEGPKTAKGEVSITVEKVVYDTAVNDSYSTNQNEALTVTAPGVLSNDTDSDTPPLKLEAELVKGPAHGSLTLNPDGSFEYTPDHNYFGSDSFTYKDNDGNTKSNEATVTITVEKVAFDHATNDSYSTNQDEALAVAAPGVLGNDTDTDSPPLELKAELVKGPSHGTLTLNSDGSFEYAPEHLFSGNDSFTYKDNDGNTKSNEATVTITVEKVAFDHAVNDSYSLNEEETLTTTATEGVLKNDTDSQSLKLEAELVKGPARGTLVLNSDGSFKYTPEANFSGSDSFTYKDNDGNTKSNEATVTLTVHHINHPPVNSVPGSQSTNENTNLVFSKAHTNQISVSDSDSEGGSEQIKLSASHGVLKLATTSGLESSSGNETSEVKATGTITALDKALEEVTYVPTHDYHGSDTIALETDDLGHTGVGGPKTATSKVSITVAAVVYDTAVNDSYTVHENAELKVAAPGVLANDTDSDTPALPLTAAVVKTTEHGTLTLNSDGSFSYAPNANFHGSDSFTYKDNDGNTTSNTATVTIAVEHFNQAPVNSVPSSVQTAYSSTAFSFSSSDSNAITVADSDSGGGVEQVKLTATHGVLAPGTTVGLVADSGNGTKDLTLEGTIVALNSALEGLTYTAESHYVGPDTLVLETDDLGNTGLGGPKTVTSSVSIEVLRGNEAPTVSAPASKEVTESISVGETSLVFSSANSDQITVADSDSEGGSELLKLSVVHGTLTPGSTSGLTVTGSGTKELSLEGTITALNGGLEGLKYVPATNYSGPDTLALEINDNGHSGGGGAKTATASVEITVVHSNPVPTNPTYSGAIGNTEFSVGVPKGSTPDVEQSGSVLPSPAEEPDGSTLSVSEETIATTEGGTVHMNEDGNFTYQPPVGFEKGSDTFHYSEHDSRGGKATGTVTIKVSGARVWYVNDEVASAGDGESNSPLKTLSSVGSAATGSGDVIFLYKGNATYTGGIELKEQQKLEGQDEGLTVEGDALVSAAGSNPTITDSAGTGVKLAEGDAVKGITVNETLGAGITATNVNAFELDSKVAIEKTTGDGLEVSGGKGEVTDEASIKTSTAHSLFIEKRTGGTFTASGSITDEGTGIDLSSNTGATINFTGKLKLSTGTNQAFKATGGGTVSASDGESTVVTTTGTAVDVANTTIGAAALSFKSVSASGAADGILLENTGSSGGLTVSGAGTADSGGEILKSTNDGVLLKSTSSTSLSWMHIHEADNFGISGEKVSGLTLAHDTLDGNNGSTNPLSGASIAMSQLTGTASISNSSITGGRHDDVRIEDSRARLIR